MAKSRTEPVNKQSGHSYVLIAILILGTAFALKCVKEPDIWWQLRTGEWIIQNMQVPVQDVFSSTMEGRPWINIKWLSEVLMAVWVKAAGISFLPILQVLVTCLILWVCLKWVTHYTPNSYLLIWPFLLLVAGSQYRFITRPEMFSHLFAVIYLYLLTGYGHQKSRKVMLLPLFQILWTNLHEAFGLGIVLCILAAAAETIQQYLSGAKRDFRLWLVTLLCIAAVTINPRGLMLLGSPSEIFSQLGRNQYTSELHGISHRDYFTFEAYVFIFLVMISAIGMWYKYRQSGMKVFEKFRFSLLFPAAGLIYLGITANRNIIFPVLALVPVYGCLIPEFFGRFQHSGKLLKGMSWLMFALMYLLVVSGRYYRLVGSRDHFGLEVLTINNPVQATDFLKEQGADFKKVWSDYLTSSYLLWEGRPDYKSYIDLRDLDVFPESFFTRYTRLLSQPDSFMLMLNKKQYDYVVLYRSGNSYLHHRLYSDTIFACVFADPVAAVYARTDNIPKGDFFSPSSGKRGSESAIWLVRLFNPFYKGYDYRKNNYDLIAARFYIDVGKISYAINRINMVLQYNPGNPEALSMAEEIRSLQQK